MVVKQGWTPEQRRAYFSWLGRASDFKGGPSDVGTGAGDPCVFAAVGRFVSRYGCHICRVT